ncbi:MAG: hypothetical protein U0441_00900 [Polyangiaceae bacterium]
MPSKKKATKTEKVPESEPPPQANVRAIGTLLTSSYGKGALSLVDEDGPVFGVVRSALPERIQAQWNEQILELWAGLDEEENVFVIVFLDFEIRDIDPHALASTLATVTRKMGKCYGSFGSLDDKHVTFVVGLPGSSEVAVPATMLADTIAYALNVATSARTQLHRAVATKKKTRTRG